MLKPLSDHVWWWVEMHGEARGEPYTWNSYAVRIPEDDELVLIDPLPLTGAECSELEELGPPGTVLLTCEYHLRDSEACRARWGCRILANEVEIDRYEADLDGTFRDGDRLWDRVRVIDVPHMYFPETAFLLRAEGGILFVGDLLTGGRLDLGVPDGALAITAPNCIPDLTKARESLRKLLEPDFRLLLPAHGTPVSDRPKEKLAAYLDDDTIWAKLEEEKRSKSEERAE